MVAVAWNLLLEPLMFGSPSSSAASTSASEEVDDYYLEYRVMRPRPPVDRMQSVDDLYEGYALVRDGESETRIGSIETEFNDVEQRFFDRGDRLVEVAAEEAREMRALLDDLDRWGRTTT